MGNTLEKFDVETVVDKIAKNYPAEFAKLEEQVEREITSPGVSNVHGLLSARDLITELFRFLYIKKHDADVSPPRLIDVAWRILLLMPKFYGTICGYITRNGMEGVSVADCLIDRNAVEHSRRDRTLQKFHDLFPNNPSAMSSLIWNEDLMNQVLQNNLMGNVDPGHVAVADVNSTSIVAGKEDRITLTITPLSGGPFYVRINKTATIATLKETIQNKRGYPVQQQHLSAVPNKGSLAAVKRQQFNEYAIQLQNESTIEEYGLGNESKVYVVLNMRGC